MSAEQDEALQVLRAVWRGQGQAAAELADEPEGKSCKRMTNVGFDEFAEGADDLQQAWRDTLAREGKLRPAGGSVKDLVLGEAESASR
jgi:hypothetical protein